MRVDIFNDPQMQESFIKKRLEFHFGGIGLKLDVSQSLFSSFDVDRGTRALLNSLRKNRIINPMPLHIWNFGTLRNAKKTFVMHGETSLLSKLLEYGSVAPDKIVENKAYCALYLARDRG